jgi:hypothetical protein
MQRSVVVRFYGILGLLTFLIVFNVTGAFSQSGEPVQTPGKVLPIFKISKGEILISRDGAFEGTFNTTYSVIANRSDFAAIGGSIKVAIINDFDRNPSIGYVRSPPPAKGYFNSTNEANLITNPFATKDQINKKIDETFTWAQQIAIESGRVNEIRCLYGDQLIEFKCEIFPAVEHLRSNALNESFIH